MEEKYKDLLKQIKKAMLEWKTAENYFDTVSDPDLIDYAIYDMEAARRKYFYLVKRSKEICDQN